MTAGPRLDVVVVDGGVNAAHPHVRGAGEIVSVGVVGVDGAFDPEGAALVDAFGHGTAVAAAILDLAPGARLGSLRVFLDAPTRPFPDVLTALAAAVALKPRCVALPLGTPRSDWDAPLLALAAAAKAADVVLVAPADFRGANCRPGCLAGVEGVLEDATLDRRRPERRVGADGRAFWFASPYPREAPGIARDRNFRGPSFATANVVGHLLAAGATTTNRSA